ncbi:MAG: VOC family protein [Nitrospinota bacterium]
MDYAFDHVHIICRDLGAMSAYFEKVFGAEEIYREDNFHGAPNAVMRLGSARFFLRGLRPGEAPGSSDSDSIMELDHFSLAVDDVAAAAAELKERGAEFIRDPGASGMGGRITAFFRGPEDIRIELSERSGATYTG